VAGGSGMCQVLLQSSEECEFLSRNGYSSLYVAFMRIEQDFHVRDGGRVFWAGNSHLLTWRGGRSWQADECW
jgi:hypothetical protein